MTPLAKFALALGLAGMAVCWIGWLDGGGTLALIFSILATAVFAGNVGLARWGARRRRNAGGIPEARCGDRGF